MSDTYKTIIAPTEGIYKEKGSKFLSFAIPVSSADEVKEIVKNYRKEYYDSRHVCYAYMLGADRKEFRANDDGEPSGTAGRPILGQINSRELTNILVIVVRYFGGILLGTGGLVVAYKEATTDALNQAEVIEKTVDESISILFDYVLMNEVMRIIKDTNAQISSQSFENQCEMQLSIRKQDAGILSAKLAKIYGLQIKE
ncbi:MAG TPA: YigZ family protein [Paludibacter sp.]|nr:YigZ family protein [Paludibacter sp.]